MHRTPSSFLLIAVLLLATPPARPVELQEYAVPKGSHPHDVAPAIDGGVWYTAQRSGELGYLDLRADKGKGRTRHIALGKGSAPHGVIVGPDGAPWIVDSGLNGIVRVDPKAGTAARGDQTGKVEVFPLPRDSGWANLNTATFDKNGVLWLTGQSGVYGRLDPRTKDIKVFRAPRGRGPYGICTAPDGSVYYASLAGSHIARIDTKTGQATVIEPPTPDQGARRVWADSRSRIWVSEWNSGQLSLYDPKTRQWKAWKLPGDNPRAYAVYVDHKDQVWVSDFGANAMVKFDPKTEKFQVFTLPSSPGRIRQILGRPGEVWGPESGVDKLIVFRE